MDILTSLLQSTVEILGPVFVMALAPMIVALFLKLWKKLGLDEEKLNRDAFQTAIATAGLEAVRRMGGPAAASRITTEALKEAVTQVKQSVPDAIRRFNVDEEAIKRRVLAQATMIVQTTPSVKPTPTFAPIDPVQPAPPMFPSPSLPEAVAPINMRPGTSFKDVVARIKAGGVQ